MADTKLIDFPFEINELVERLPVGRSLSEEERQTLVRALKGSCPDLPTVDEFLAEKRRAVAEEEARK